MITPAWCRLMAAYNSEMNRRIYAAAAEIPDEARRRDAGAFFGSLHGTLNHLLWADRMWMSRLAGWERPSVGIPGSTSLIGDFDELRAARFAADARIESWAAGITPDWLAGELTWFSGATQRERREKRRILLVHVFNHQTHHRGQAHCLITQNGVTPADTDLSFILDLKALDLT
jgi:uncharacterized damage-inducible protein DinB